MNDMKENPVSFRAIMLGTLASLALLLLCGLCAAAILFSFADKPDAWPSPLTLPVLANVAAFLFFLFMFFCAAVIANSCTSLSSSRQTIIFNSLGTWSLLTVIISVIALTAMLAINLKGINSPFFVTEVHVTKLSAVTRIDFPRAEEKQIVEQRRLDQLKSMISWTTFLSVFFGLGVSFLGGWSVHRRRR